MTPTRLELFGTDEPPNARRTIAAGPLTVVLEGGGLRDIRFHGVEVLRAISYLARDAAWGTYDARMEDLLVEESQDGFTIAYRATCGTGEARFSYAMRISGQASGGLVLDAEGEALGDFQTNRTGFVVLHPAEAAGGRLTIVHSDGQREETAFPQRISPDQPAYDIAAMIHEPAPNMRCEVKMSGDAFEMEDQRNWADASFKTYIRPLSKLRPYVIAKGERDVQQIAVRISGMPADGEGTSSGRVRLEVGQPRGVMPKVALFLDGAHLPDDVAIAWLPKPAWSELIIRFDPARGHNAAYLRKAAAVADKIGAGVALELIFDARDPDGEARSFLNAVVETGLVPSALLVSPQREFKTRPSGTIPEGEADTDVLVSALRRAGATCPIGAGTVSNFTEFNRNPPGPAADFVYFGVSAIVHAADDISVMETTSVYPALIDSASALAPAKPIWLGPCTIATRHNPYGADVVANPDRRRRAAAREDPRQEALFAAAYAAAIATRAAGRDVDRLILGAPTGPFGLVGDNGRIRPLATVCAVLAGASGLSCFEIQGASPSLAAIAFGNGPDARLLLANLTARPMRVDVPAFVGPVMLLQGNGVLASLETAHGTIEVPAYGVVLVHVE